MKGRAAARTGPGQRGLSHQGGIRYGKAAQTREVSLLSFIKLQVLIFLMQEKLSVSSRHIPGWALSGVPKLGQDSARIPEGPRAGNGS